MAKIKILFLIVCVLARFNRANTNSSCINDAYAQKIVEIAKSQIHVRELTGNNDGKLVEEFLHHAGLPKGNPWCAAFVSWVYGKAGFKTPRTAWSPALFPKSKLVKTIKPGFIYGLYNSKKGRIVHCGIALKQNSDWVFGIEGNTNIAGSVDGDGVYIKRRHKFAIHSIANWISKTEK